MGYLPGVFTDQGQFDQELNSFADTAARQSLKAEGETRPTDADVEGKKSSLFGVGRDEATNINLLTNFIKMNEDLDAELDLLTRASATGQFNSFTGGNLQQGNNLLQQSDNSLPEAGQVDPRRARLEELRAKKRQRGG
jgi:hypothetical protein